ncbi:MAG: hypothetical protein ACT4O9_15995 [Blastocatellia bacterium]
MIEFGEIRAVVELYEKHGWMPRRVILTAASAGRVEGELRSFLPDCGFTNGDGDIDAIWFSRRSLDDSESWELRRLSGTPYALVISLLDESPQDVREETLKETETEMFARSRILSGH